jgi:hypothetical protein
MVFSWEFWEELKFSTELNGISIDDFTLNNARVLCRDLNLPVRDVKIANAQLVASQYRYDIVKGPKYHSKTWWCVGTEYTLNYCYDLSTNYCSHT